MLDDVINFFSLEVIFSHFFPNFSGSLLMTLQKDSFTDRYEQNEYFFPALYFYPKYVMRS